MSHGIYFSSLRILKTSDGILFLSEKIEENSEIIQKKMKKRSENVVRSLRMRAEFVGGMILNSRRKH